MGKVIFFFFVSNGEQEKALRLNPISLLTNTLLAMEKGKLFRLTNLSLSMDGAE